MKLLTYIFSSTVLFNAAAAYAVEESLESVQSRDIEQRFALTRPAGTPVASVVLLAGGHGKLNLGSFLGSVKFGWGKDNNLVRTRDQYAEKGFLVATMDAPSDRDKMNAIWRVSAEHAADIEAVARYLKAQANVPVWVIGTSMGTFSAANAGVRLGDTVDGIVLTSSITRSNPKWKIYDTLPSGIINMDLSTVSKPVLVISHQDDQCKLTPASDIEQLAGQFTSSPKVETLVVTGGDSPRSDPCKALSAHGFLGVEDEVVDKIATFINANP
ncbi:alpha/beta hydrolase [Thiosocius teredinicola]|uniref:alpha/beta hydrolase n=1 Tax=Thiosocius teredinicola TaxID=1973002 RepID=UPI000991493E